MRRDSRIGKFIYLMPRALAILFIVFLSIFALDVFAEDYTVLETIVALFMHLIPSFIVILVLIASWKEELIGGVLFVILGIAYFIMSWGKATPVAYVFMIGPVFLTGILFLLNKKLK